MQNPDDKDPTYFRLRELTKYDIIPAISEDRRKAIMYSAIARKPNLAIRGKPRISRWNTGHQSLQESL